ncbi:MAG TPA: YeeE/YedE thiosulfate transporter family protein [Longimicrobiales bacterium]|nr:YeeE/YedE thiosulfate transporter family protein [Longimicrobiales bacterium]
MLTVLRQPWPWWLTGIGIGLVVPALLLIGNRSFGVSSNLRHLCAAVCPADVAFFKYDWKRNGLWNLTFAIGILIGGYLGGVLLRTPEPMALAAETKQALAALGIDDFSGLAPRSLFTWSALTSLPGILLIVGGGFLVGFGTAYGGGCTSGHGVSGLANFQLPSLIACIGFFVGGIIASRLLLPLVL